MRTKIVTCDKCGEQEEASEIPDNWSETRLNIHFPREEKASILDRKDLCESCTEELIIRIEGFYNSPLVRVG